MISSVKFITKHRCFAKGKTFKFEPGLNVLVGANGSGKSTVLSALRGQSKCEVEIVRDDIGPLIAWDAEKDNLRTQPFLDVNINLHVRSMFMSHGQANVARLNKMFDEARTTDGYGVIIFDEPEAGLSLPNVAGLARMLGSAAAAGWQIIIATHHPDLIAAADKVRDFDNGGRAIKADTYLTRARGVPGAAAKAS